MLSYTHNACDPIPPPPPPPPNMLVNTSHLPISLLFYWLATLDGIALFIAQFNGHLLLVKKAANMVTDRWLDFKT